MSSRRLKGQILAGKPVSVRQIKKYAKEPVKDKNPIHAEFRNNLIQQVMRQVEQGRNLSSDKKMVTPTNIQVTPNQQTVIEGPRIKTTSNMAGTLTTNKKVKKR